jgi:ATP-dependent Clp protease ATP-binding subunit ClpA
MPRRLNVDAVKWLLTLATEEARLRGDRRLGTDHLLLGLLHDDSTPAAKAVGVTLADARAASDKLDVAALAAVGVEVETLGEGPPAGWGRRFPPLTSGARTVIKRAIDEVHRLKSGRIDTTHLLVALLWLECPDPAAELLKALGVEPAAVRARLGDRAEGEVA